MGNEPITMNIAQMAEDGIESANLWVRWVWEEAPAGARPIHPDGMITVWMQPVKGAEDGEGIQDKGNGTGD